VAANGRHSGPDRERRSVWGPIEDPADPSCAKITTRRSWSTWCRRPAPQPGERSRGSHARVREIERLGLRDHGPIRDRAEVADRRAVERELAEPGQLAQRTERGDLGVRDVELLEHRHARERREIVDRGRRDVEAGQRVQRGQRRQLANLAVRHAEAA
jgi:hypothetical protein